jgi:hypothetical protein
MAQSEYRKRLAHIFGVPIKSVNISSFRPLEEESFVITGEGWMLRVGVKESPSASDGFEFLMEATEKLIVEAAERIKGETDGKV